ncbi:MAG TPA: hypothetical protein VKC15_14405 [Gemmatimonadales bacterium]|nr:hypothetical protein [Gemmatimonadales bacterium]
MRRQPRRKEPDALTRGFARAEDYARTALFRPAPVPRCRWVMDVGGPTHVELAPPAFGDSARLCAALRERRAVKQEIDAAFARLRPALEQVTSGPGVIRAEVLRDLDVEHATWRQRVSDAEAHVTRVKAEIRERRIAGATASAGDAAERAMCRLFPEDVPAVPWGVRPKAGARLGSRITDEPPVGAVLDAILAAQR